MIYAFIKDLLKYLPALIIPPIIGFITIPIVTRLFPPDIYGTYTLVIVTTSLMRSSFILGITPSVIRFFPEYQRKQQTNGFKINIIFQTLMPTVFISLLSLLILSLLGGHISKDFSFLMRIGILAFALGAFNPVLRTLLRSQFLVNWYSFSVAWTSIVGIGTGLLLVIVFHFGIDGLLWGSVIAGASLIPIIWRKAIGKLKFDRSALSLRPTLEMAKYGLPLVPVGITALMLSSLDRYVIKLFRGSYEVGVYSVGYGLTQSCMVLASSLVMLPGGPISINLWESEGAEQAREFINRMTRYYLMLAIPALAGLIVLCKPIIAVLTGGSYHEAYNIVPFVASGMILLGLQHRFHSGLIFYKKTTIIAYCFAISTLLNVGLNFIFIPIYGYIAAAITTLICYAVNLVLIIITSRRFFTWQFPFRSLVKVTFASTIMAVSVFGLSHLLTVSLVNLILLVCSGVIVYIVTLFSIRELQRSEIKALLEMKAKLLERLKSQV